MNDKHSTSPGSTPDDCAELDVRWQQLQTGLDAYLYTMADPDEQDHLIIELPDRPGDVGTAPYAQFAGFGDGQMLRAELTGNAFLSPVHQLDEEADTILRALNWRGNDDEEPNWFVEGPIASAADVADEVVRALRHVFGVVHPQLLTYRAWGPAAAGVDVIGLVASEDVQSEAPQPPPPVTSVLDLAAVTPADHDELVQIVADLLREQFEGEPGVDDDGDFVLQHSGQPVWIRVLQDAPAIEVFTCVAQGVHPRRAAAVEVGILNRDHRWMKWVLADRQVWQTLTLPGRPFVPAHLAVLLELFFEALDETREDLMYRTGSRTA